MDEHHYKWKEERTIVNGKTAYYNGTIVDGVRGMALEFNT